jgi:hypothetical protein
MRTPCDGPRSTWVLLDTGMVFLSLPETSGFSGQEDLARIEDVAGIECLLDRAHHGDSRFTRLVDEGLPLA